MDRLRSRRRAAIALALLLTACSSAPSPSTSASSDLAPASGEATASAGASAPAVLTAIDLQQRIEPSALEAHLAALQAIADDPAGDGSRANGTPGFSASVDYVVGKLEAAGYGVERQEVAIPDGSTTNVLAERRGTGPGVVMVGAHLDSVAAGPGINDNASGVAALLVIAEQLIALPAPSQTVRFAFWGAEEGGPFGSAAYVDSLDALARAEIHAYLNLDMIGSPNAVTFVYDEADAAAGSAALTNVVADVFDRRGFPWVPIDLEGDSDHGPFIAAGIPTGGLFSGGIEPVTEAQAARFGATAGEPADPCSHQACDTLDNVDLATLGLMAAGIANAIVLLAAAAAS